MFEKREDYITLEQIKNTIEDGYPVLVLINGLYYYIADFQKKKEEKEN